MEILKISKTEKEAVVRLSVEEMKVICNMFYRTGEKIEGDPLYHQLYSEMLIATVTIQKGREPCLIYMFIRCVRGIKITKTFQISRNV